MIGIMMNFHPGSFETKEEFVIRRATVIKALRERYEVETFDAVAHRYIYSWGGHVARMASYDRDRATFQTLIYKDWNWIGKWAAQNGGRQCHGRYLRTWRWERPLYKFFAGKDWKEEAKSKRDWTSNLESMVKWRLANR